LSKAKVNYLHTGITVSRSQYFDPSVIFQTIFFHNDRGELVEERSVGRLGQSLGSKIHKYDILGRRVSTTLYNEEGTVEKIYNTVYDDENFKTYDYYSDSNVKLNSIREVLLDNQGRKYVETILDGQDRVLEKNVYLYDNQERIKEIIQKIKKDKEYSKKMLRLLTESRGKEITPTLELY